jgi:hypothetical protein
MPIRRAGSEGDELAAVPADAFLSALEREKWRLISDALARRAAQDPIVGLFRKNVFEDRRLTPEEAEAFFVSPAIRFLHRRHFPAHRIPYASHRAELRGWEADWIPAPSWEQVYSNPTFVYDTLDVNREWYYRCRAVVWVEPPGVELDAEFLANDPAEVRHVPYLPERFGFETGKPDPFPQMPKMFPQSVADQLLLLAEHIRGQVPWEVWEAAWFVVTGERPLLQPLRVSTLTPVAELARRGEVALRAEPGVSGESVLRAYRQMQRELLGYEPRRLKERTLKLFEFVFQQREPSAPVKPTWKAMMDAWNRIHPEWSYRDVRVFHRDVQRVEHALMSLPSASARAAVA